MINKRLDFNIKKIKEDTKNSPDYKYKYINIGKENICLIYNQSLSSNEKIESFILKNISIASYNKVKSKDIINFLYNFIPGGNIKKISTFNKLYDYIQNGFAIVLIDGFTEGLAIEERADLTRAIIESQVEKTVNGPKDAFVENIITNIGLIRRRIKSNNLVFEQKIVGKETKTKINIAYMNNIVEKKLLNYIREKIEKIDTNSVIDSNYIANLINDNNYVFPMFQITERPDLTSMFILEGKICIMVDTSPFAIIIPTFFIDLFHTSEDYYQKTKNISLTRIIRLIAFFISILLPGLYIAIITYNHETIPPTLLINIASQRAGVPFPAFIEAFIMTITFEILRESDIRQPTQMGNAISILGGIILGDAAVAAGVVSPIMVIVISITAISSMMFSRIDIVNAFRSWRYIFMIFASFLGLAGVYFCSFLFLTMLASYKSFGKPFLYPLAPINFKMLKDSFIKIKGEPKKTKNPLLIKDDIQ